MVEVQNSNKRGISQALLPAVALGLCGISLVRCPSRVEESSKPDGNFTWATDVSTGVRGADQFLNAHPELADQFIAESLRIDFILFETQTEQSFRRLYVQTGLFDLSNDAREALLPSFGIDPKEVERSLEAAEEFLERPEIASLRLNEDQGEGVKELFVLAKLLPFKELQESFARDYALSKRLPLEVLTPVVQSIEDFIEIE